MRIIELLKSHKWAIVLALLSAVIISFPQAYLRYDAGEAYGGIDIMAVGDEGAYLAQVREVQDGHFSSSNPYFKEGKDDPYLFQPLGPAIEAILGKILFLDFKNTVLVSRFFFPFLSFLIIYGFVLAVSKEKLTALAGASMVILGSNLLSRAGIFNLLAGVSPQLDFLNFARPVVPSISAIFFFGFLLAFWLFLERKQWRWGILSAIILGLSFYIYFYNWTFLYVFLGILFIIFLFQKKWQNLKQVGIIIIIGLIISIPYFINFYEATLHPNFLQASQRFGLTESRVPTLGFLIPLLFIAFLMFFPKEQRERFWFFLALLLTPFIVLNQQLLTGKTLINAHYHWYFHTPLAIIVLLIIFFYWLKRLNFSVSKKFFAVVLILASIYAGLFIQKASYSANRENSIYQQRYGPIMAWLDDNSEKEEIVFANNDISHFIVTYTSLYVFSHSTAKFSLAASEDRLTNNLFLFYRLTGLKTEDVEKTFLKDRSNISSFIYAEKYRQSTGDYSGISDEVILSIAEKYRDSLLVPDDEFLRDYWKKYGVNYAVWDTDSNPGWDFDKYQFLKETYQEKGIKIYEVL
ncbi:MAG: hypothetical protein Q7T34_01180 [Candidatus Parcubacteria bacterium]|nr:hypothetical protein [Candidatus Parcubacteria bacterium]